MKSRDFYRTALLLATALAMTACACPRTPSYKGTPYESERTAGSGPSQEQDGHCLGRLLPGH